MALSAILITGGTGFIGSHLARLLASEGDGKGERFAIHILGRSGKNKWRIEDFSDQVVLHEGNLKNKELVASIVKEVSPQYVVHLASALDHRRDFDLLADHIGSNVIGTLNLMDAVRKSPVHRILNIGTCEEYGDGPAPFREGQREIPVSPYSFSKICTTHLSSLCARIFDLPVLTVRPFLTYGEGQSPTLLIPQVIIGCLREEEMKFTEGKQTREVNYVADIARGLRSILLSDQIEPGSVVNLGNSTPVSVQRIVQTIFSLTKSGRTPRFGELAYRKGEAMSFYSDTSRLAERYRFTPQVGLEEGLTRTIRWYQANLGRLGELFATSGER